MTIDWTIKATDLVMVAVVFAGPLVAVQVTEWIRRRQEARSRKIHLFRTLMSTRASTLAPSHVEALNLIDIEFDVTKPEEKKVIEAWKLYHAHLGDQSYPFPAWSNRQVELLVDLLHEMAVCLGYSFDKSQIKSASYFPRGYGEVESEQHEFRKAALSVFKGERPLFIAAVPQQPEANQAPQRNASTTPVVHSEPPVRRG